jgi:hypothetical protein
MTDVKIGFEMQKIRLSLAVILPVRQLKDPQKNIRRYQKIRASIKEAGLVVRWTPSFRPLSAENKMDSRGLLSWLFLFVGRSFCALKSFGKERTSCAWHYPSSLSVFAGSHSYRRRRSDFKFF